MLLSLIGLIPGISVLAGICILILSLQILIGRRTPRLPAVLARRRLNVEKLRQIMRKPVHYITQLEKMIKPRFAVMLLPLMNRATGLIVFSLGLIMISPLPLSNILPAIALLQIALGLLESDGLVILAGWVFSVFAIAVGVFMILAALEIATWYFAN